MEAKPVSGADLSSLKVRISTTPMSALGHQQTYAVQQGMSALRPIATAKADIRKTTMSALPPKATLNASLLMSAKGQKRTLFSITSSARARSDGGTVRPSAEIAISSWTEVQLYHRRGNPKLAEPRKKRLKKRR